MANEKKNVQTLDDLTGMTVRIELGPVDFRIGNRADNRLIENTTLVYEGPLERLIYAGMEHGKIRFSDKERKIALEDLSSWQESHSEVIDLSPIIKLMDPPRKRASKTSTPRKSPVVAMKDLIRRLDDGTSPNPRADASLLKELLDELDMPLPDRFKKHLK